ncbi:MAG: DsbC family protein [Candidatus Saccharibacteria bacterium]|nr:DsbC family protein [Moraxellaceae bacterium]
MKLLLPVAATLLLTISGCSKASSDTPSTTPASVAATTTTQTIAGNAPESVRKAIAARIQKAGLDAKIAAIISTEMPNLYWVTFNDVPPVYMSGDGQFLLQGDLVKLGDNEVIKISDSLKAQETKRLITAIPEKDLIIFSPASKPKAVIYAFTDVDCGYCRKLHGEIEQINAKGIEVRYLAWPRSAGDVAINQAVWCSEDRKSAITTAKHGLPVQAPDCKSPVLEQRRIGMQIGVNGTPAIYNSDGKYLGGYMPANDLAKILNIDAK